MIRSLAMHGLPDCTHSDRWAVWPCGTEVSLDERSDFEELLSWKSDDYAIKTARGYDESFNPVFED